MFQPLRIFTLSSALIAIASAASAACDPEKPGGKLTYAEAQTVYSCLKEEIHDGYMQGDKKRLPAAFVRDYRSWTRVSRLPANPGFHGGRFLLTYVNDVGADEYKKFLDERGPMPAGAVIAKESFFVNDTGEVEKGPLFLMQKVETNVSPETND